MACGVGCSTEDIENKEYQDLSGWRGVTLRELLSRLVGKVTEEVRIYTVATTKFNKDSKIIGHYGSGPNLEGGLATLCTCKHSMRRYHNCDEWKGKWILGLTSRDKNKGFCGEHYLLYMMKVEQAFESHLAFYKHLAQTNPAALRIKNAVTNRLGDIFMPQAVCTNPLDPRMYEFPHKNHSHGHDVNEDWEDDISYMRSSPAERLPTPLLLGDIENTFVWPKPMIKFELKQNTGNRKLTLGEDFFASLKDA
ncbi:hypothetical protein HS096_07045 [candidate division WWE3 bacterium]|uniref:Uncharacterized protein n=1 Tax=candidate division WWE3 bacterium TaxID=2053526 RepID=A0A928Y7B5_UNCKA|nr:hypothetical protein [candidate division WWE3 bacterium]